MRFSVGRVDSFVHVRGDTPKADEAHRDGSVDKDEMRQVVRQILEEERERNRRLEAWR